MYRKLAAEFLGTATLVLIGCGAAVLGGTHVGQLGVALAFGLAVVAMAYAIGPVSGCHVNPAVSFAAYVAGRMGAADLAYYALAQVAGALVGALALLMIASGAPTYSLALDGLGQNGFGPGFLGSYSPEAAFIFEAIATFVFVVVILGVTGPAGQGPFAGLAIGLTLAAIHIVGIQVTGVSVNPARSIGPALLVQGDALSHLWMFIVAPLAGAGAGGFLFRQRWLEPEGVADSAAGTHPARTGGPL